MNSSFFDVLLFSLTVATLLLQIYLIWLVICKTPKRMESFRFALFMLSQNEILLTISIGFIMDPDLLIFEAAFRGGIVNGLARFLGPEGGRYGFAIGMFFGASVFCNQIYCLMFRFVAVQQNYPKLHKIFNKLNTRIIFFLFTNTICAVCAIMGFHAMANPKEIQTIISAAWHKKYMTDEIAAKMARNETIYILLNLDSDGMYRFDYFIFVSYPIVTILSIIFSVLIFRTIHRNVAHFTAHTFKLHLQLTALLIVQFCLPILFLIGPVCYAFLSVIFVLPLDGSGSIGQISILLLSIYTMANSLVTLLFIAPYREFTLRKFGLKKAAVPIRRRLSLKTTKPPPGQLPFNSESIAEGQIIECRQNELS